MEQGVDRDRQSRDDQRHAERRDQSAGSGLAGDAADIERVTDGLKEEPARQIGNPELGVNPVTATIPRRLRIATPKRCRDA
jgi:hypothetical protein